jgi:hypothetical protein
LSRSGEREVAFGVGVAFGVEVGVAVEVEVES